jgi:hypothetical protein
MENKKMFETTNQIKHPVFEKKSCARLHGQMRIDDENDEVKRPRKCPVAGRVDQW